MFLQPNEADTCIPKIGQSSKATVHVPQVTCFETILIQMGRKFGFTAAKAEQYLKNRWGNNGQVFAFVLACLGLIVEYHRAGKEPCARADASQEK